ncbi:ABC transporter ATP-binding protein [Leptospira stimsonii]|uniref:ABC transporter permease n=1 Tax=Leptospira stimsonii TaxID=2202203 RepID=A0A396ZDS8_9LEPT|nr:ABC transporter ATP-binding protein [Leptospira stimsonii]RHX92054.1 ABC transporter permease [Leptospira stimsonii]
MKRPLEYNPELIQKSEPLPLEKEKGTSKKWKAPNLKKEKPSSENEGAPGLLIFGLFRFVKKYKGRIFLIIGLLCFEIGFYASIPFSFKYLIDEALINRNQNALYWIGAYLAVGTVTFAILGTLRDYLYNWASSRIIQDLRLQMYEHLDQLSLDFFSNNKLGDILSRFFNDLASLEHALLAFIPWGLGPLLEALFGTILLFLLDWKLALIALLIWPISFLGPGFLSRKSTEISYSRKLEEAQVLSMVEESISAQNLIRAYDLSDYFFSRFKNNCEKLFQVSLRLGLTNSYLERSAGSGILLLQGVLLLAGTAFAYNNTLSIGTLAAFLPPFLNLSYSLLYLSQYLPALNHASGSAKRILELLRAPVFESNPEGSSIPELKEEIRFDNVHFRYKGRSKNLSDISLTIPKGSYTAIVGGSGVGKSTFIKLLLGMVQPNEGRIFFDGIDLNSVSRSSVRSLVGVVFQETFLFNTTIFENIRIGKPSASLEEVIEAAKRAEIHELILSLPMGYETNTGDRGTKLSGGERQRIAIARAFLRNPQILLLDEATSSLDPVTEARIMKTLSLLREGRTVISVTHRLSTIREADQVFQIRNGKLERFAVPEPEQQAMVL